MIQTVDDYIDAQPRPVRAALERVRRAIRKTLPDAEETISYKMPAYKLHGRVVIYFAGWTEHYSIYPAIGGLVPAFQEELKRYKVTKGAIRFPLSEPVPVKLIERIAKFRAKAVAERKSKRAV
jgi:uncharacterized protein YdhG (YjbR/CyaY superfamily)